MQMLLDLAELIVHSFILFVFGRHIVTMGLFRQRVRHAWVHALRWPGRPGKPAYRLRPGVCQRGFDSSGA